MIANTMWNFTYTHTNTNNNTKTVLRSSPNYNVVSKETKKYSGHCGGCVEISIKGVIGG